MKKLILLSFAVFILVGCSGGGADFEEAVIEACKADGGPPEVCSCAANSLSENLSPELRQSLLTALSEGKGSREWEGSLSAEDSELVDKVDDIIEDVCL